MLEKDEFYILIEKAVYFMGLVIVLCVLLASYAEACCFDKAAERHGVPVVLLQAIADVESSGGKDKDHPVNDNGSQDYGVMGINSWWKSQVGEKYWKRIISSDCGNVMFGAWVLRQCLDSYKDLPNGIGCYHSSSKRLSKKYAQRVMDRLVTVDEIGG